MAKELAGATPAPPEAVDYGAGWVEEADFDDVMDQVPAGGDGQTADVETPAGTDDEADAPTKETDDEAVVDEVDDETDEDEDSDENEESDEDDDEQEAETDQTDIAAQLREAFPDAELGDDPLASLKRTYEEAGELRTRVEGLSTDLEQERAASEMVVSVFSEHPELVQVVKAVKGGSRLQDVLLETFGDLMTMPDKEEDPDAYAEWKVAEDRRKREAESRREMEEKAATQYDRDRAEAMKRFKMDDTAMSEFEGKVRRYLMGDPVSGRLPSDFFDVFHKGLGYEKAVADAKEQGKVEGRNEAISEVRGKRAGGTSKGKAAAGDGIPKPKSGGEQPTTKKSPHVQLAEDLSVDETWWE